MVSANQPDLRELSFAYWRQRHPPNAFTFTFILMPLVNIAHYNDVALLRWPREKASCLPFLGQANATMSPFV
jgi:hypothetical protein